MAKVYEKVNNLQVELDTKYKTSKLTIILLVAVSLLFFPFGLIVPFIYLNSNKMTKKKILKKGLEGEKFALNVFKKLDDSFYVFNDLNVKYDGKNSQIDTVIVGDYGVFITEIKNIKGEIYGDVKDDQLTIRKIGSGGSEYFKEMYNPCKQVNTHVYRLSKYLKERDINVWIDGIVYLVPQPSINYGGNLNFVNNSDNVIYDNTNEMLERINAGNKLISKDTKNRIIKELIQLSNED